MSEDPDYIRSDRLTVAKRKLEDAISEFHQINAEEHNDMGQVIVLDWMVILAGTNYETYGKGLGTKYSFIVPDNQPWHHSIGLVDYADVELRKH